jgi:predicted GNAT family N-acyltransferase
VGEFRFGEFPAVKIARLAVDQTVRKQYLGKKLVDWALAITKSYVMPNVGCRFMTVDSKRESIEFYEKCGFTMLNTAHNKAEPHPLMYIDLGKIT